MAARPPAAAALRQITIGVSALAAMALAAPARSAEPPAGAAPAPAVSPDGWEFDLAPYLWLAGVKGDVAVSSRLPPAHISATFSQILGDLKFGFMLDAGVRHDRIVGMADLMYFDVQSSTHVGVRDPEFLNVRLTSKQLTATLLGGYRLIDHGDSSVDLMAGGRIMSLDNRLDLEGPTRKLSGDGSLTWVDPIVALRARGPISTGWSYTVYGDVGGSGGLTWQALGLVNYRASPRWTMSGGWRHLAVDHHDGDFRFDVDLDGPIVGASYRF
jgi:hypothetical protein